MKSFIKCVLQQQLCLHYTTHPDNIITVTGMLGMSLCNKSINRHEPWRLRLDNADYWRNVRTLSRRKLQHAVHVLSTTGGLKQKTAVSLQGRKNSLIVRKPQILCNRHREFRIASIVSSKSYEYVVTGQNEAQAFRTVSLTLR